MSSIPAATTGRAAARPVVARSGRKWVEIALFVGPAIALYVLFLLVPVVQAVHYSFYSWTGLGALTDFVGLHNYREAFGDPPSGRRWSTTGSSRRSRSASSSHSHSASRCCSTGRFAAAVSFGSIFFAPYVLSEAVTGVLFLQILQPDNLVDELLRSVGLGGLVQLWLADLRLVFYTLFVVITWKYIGFAIILLLAGLQGVPDELHEAAAMDGASSWETLRHVTLPLLGPTIRIWVFLSVIGSIQLFDLVWIMTLGGPAGASSTMATYMVDQGVNSYRIGYATAVAAILFLSASWSRSLYQVFVLRRDTVGGTARMAG